MIARAETPEANPVSPDVSAPVVATMWWSVFISLRPTCTKAESVPFFSVRRCASIICMAA
eukprot:scaffold74194_cov66-Phaeocystis_antarctica.AAC.3